GGAEIFLSRFIDELLKRGHTCHIFAAKWDEKSHPPLNPLSSREEREMLPSLLAGEGQGEGVAAVGQNHAPASSKQGSKLIFHKIKTFGPSFLRILSFAINSSLVVKKANLDVVISFERTLYQDIYRAGDGCHREWLIQREKARVKGQGSRVIKKIITFLNPLHLTLLRLEKRLFQSKRLKFVVANSVRGKEEIIRHYKLPEEKICVIYNGIDLETFNPCERDKIRSAYRERLNIKSEIMLLFVGSGFERKGMKFLIEALGILKRDGYKELKLVVVGKGHIETYRNIAERCGVGADVKFIGPAKDINGYYCAADIFVLPSIYEPFSNACLEAMAAGLPVVTSRINGVSEILTDGKDGMIVNDPANPEELARVFRPAIADLKVGDYGKGKQ
ncbi:MAG: glycosyltransferase family 4 protein, partial [Deltaproteobacteria bacterium]|nr:glycosyltransferase family 4 protein [Deltaproteobacteria bacterium]